MRDQRRMMDCRGGRHDHLAQHGGIAGAKFPARLTLRDQPGDRRHASGEEFIDRRPVLLQRNRHDVMDALLIGHLVAKVAIQGHQHGGDALACAARPRRGLSGRLDQQIKLVPTNGFGQRILRGKEAIDIGAGHPQRRGDVGDRRLAKTELAEKTRPPQECTGGSLRGFGGRRPSGL